jgi:hypothetical protein
MSWPCAGTFFLRVTFGHDCKKIQDSDDGAADGSSCAMGLQQG